MDSTTSDEKRPKKTRRLPPLEMKVTQKPKDQPFVLIYLEGEEVAGAYQSLVPLEVYEAEWKPLFEPPTRPRNYDDVGCTNGEHRKWKKWAAQMANLALNHDEYRVTGDLTLDANIVRVILRDV